MTAQLDIFTNAPHSSLADTAASAAYQVPMPVRVGGSQTSNHIGFKSVQAANFSHYPYVPGFKDRTTSQDAAIKMHDSGCAKRIQQLCLDALTVPSTAQELWERLGVNRDYIRPRLTELRNMGKIRRTGERRKGQHVLERVA